MTQEEEIKFYIQEIKETQKPRLEKVLQDWRDKNPDAKTVTRNFCEDNITIFYNKGLDMGAKMILEKLGLN